MPYSITLSFPASMSAFVFSIIKSGSIPFPSGSIAIVCGSEGIGVAECPAIVQPGHICDFAESAQGGIAVLRGVGQVFKQLGHIFSLAGRKPVRQHHRRFCPKQDSGARADGYRSGIA